MTNLIAQLDIIEDQKEVETFAKKNLTQPILWEWQVIIWRNS